MNGSIPIKHRRMFCRVMSLVVSLMLILGIAAPTIVYASENPAVLIVKQIVLSPSVPPEVDTFTYLFLPIELETLMPAEETDRETGGYTFTISGNGSFEIGPLSFNQPGIYRYELFQVVAPDDDGHQYDNRVYTIEARVSTTLEVNLIVFTEDGGKTDSIEFFVSSLRDPEEDNPQPHTPDGPKPNIPGSPDNTVAPPPTPKPGPKTGYGMNTSLNLAVLGFGVLVTTCAAVYLIRERREDTYENT